MTLPGVKEESGKVEATNSMKNGVYYPDKVSYLEEKYLVEKSLHNFELTFSPLLAGGGLLPGTCKVCCVLYNSGV